MNLRNKFSGLKVLEEVESPINGKIRVVKSLGFGTYIQVENLTQSGGVVKGVWRFTLRKVKQDKPNVRNALVLGLGGGTIAGLIRRYWPKGNITGVDLDLIMVDLGKKYLGLDKTGTEIVIGDAYWFAKKQKGGDTKYDLVLMDVYVGHEVPGKFETEEFLGLVLNLLAEDGVVVFNRLYFDEYKKKAEVFRGKLERIFREVEPVYPEANVMYVCKA